jgi:hypothetical protein
MAEVYHPTVTAIRAMEQQVRCVIVLIGGK